MFYSILPIYIILHISPYITIYYQILEFILQYYIVI